MLPAVVVAAAISAIISRKFRITPIPAYIFAGMAISEMGMHLEEVETIGKLGVVFLLFYIGLKISPDSLRRGGSKALPSGFIDLTFNFFPPLLILLYLGFSLPDSLILSSAVYISSSAINLKMLVDNKKLIFAFAETVVLLMVFEDIVLVLLLSLLSASDLSFLYGIAAVILVSAALYTSTPYLQKLMGREDEIPYLLTFSIPSFALFLAEKLRISEALAAILFGLALHRCKFDIILIPFKEVFIAVFFILFGSMIDFRLDYVALILILLAVIGKLVGAYFIGVFLHKSKKDAKEIFRYTLARGEFSVIFPALFAPEYAPAVAAVVLFTSILGSLMARVRV
jgi:CPA2 family monovalent cation:H+ antiporter-2